MCLVRTLLMYCDSLVPDWNDGVDEEKTVLENEERREIGENLL